MAGRPPGSPNKLSKQAMQDRIENLTRQIEALKVQTAQNAAQTTAQALADTKRMNDILYQLGRLEGALLLGKEIEDED